MLQRVFVLVLLVCSLSACSYFRKHNFIGDQGDVYQKAQFVPPLTVPSSLTHTTIGSKTESLPTNVTAQSLPTIPPPPGSLAQHA